MRETYLVWKFWDWIIGLNFVVWQCNAMTVCWSESCHFLFISLATLDAPNGKLETLKLADFKKNHMPPFKSCKRAKMMDYMWFEPFKFEWKLKEKLDIVNAIKIRIRIIGINFQLINVEPLRHLNSRFISAFLRLTCTTYNLISSLKYLHISVI